MPVCAVNGCFTSSKTTPDCTFFQLPRSPLARARWLEALGRPLDTPGSLAVCARHFPESAYTARGSSRLLQNSVPTLLLTPLQQQSSSLSARDKSLHLEKVSFLQNQLAKANRDFLANKTLLSETKQPECKQSVKPGASDDLPVCRVCLAVDEQLYSVWSSRFMDTFAQLTGTSLSAGGFPRRLCGPCRAQLSECAAFRERCRKTHSLLQTLLEWGPLSMNDIKAIDRYSHKLTNKPTRLKQGNENKKDVLEIVPLVKTEGETSFETEVEILRYDVGIEMDSDKKVATQVKAKVEKVKLEGTDADECLETEDWIEIELKSDNVDTDAVIKTDELRKKRAGTSKKYLKTEDCTEIEMKCDAKKTKLNPTKKKVAIPLRGKKRRIYELRTAGYHPSCKRKKIGDEYFPDFDYEAFEKKFDVKIKFLTHEEQKQEIEDRKKSNEGEFCCKICGKVYLREKTMKSHMFLHDPSSGRHECQICLCRFRQNSRLLKHQDTHRLVFTCQTCDHVTRDRSAARNHYLMHQGKTYKCRHCDLVYELKNSWLNHMRIAHPGQNVACDECGETFLSANGVNLHKALAHRPNLKPKTEFKCSVCDVAFSSSAALDRHTEVSAGVSHAALWPCGTCGDSCGSQAELAAHNQELHPPDRLRCDECDKTFANATSFDTHVKRKHLNQRATKPINQMRRFVRRVPGPKEPVVCEICGRVVKNETLLRIHMDTHVRPFACTKCPKTFPNQFNRECHMRVHTGERPFQCAECPLRFALQGNLVRHRKVVHQNQRASVPCELCSKTFTTRHTMLLHVKYVHHNMPWPKRERKPKKTIDSDN